MNVQELTESFACLFLVSGLCLSMLFGCTLQFDFYSEFPSVYWFGNKKAFPVIWPHFWGTDHPSPALGEYIFQSPAFLYQCPISAPDVNLQGLSGNMEKTNTGQGKAAVKVSNPAEFHLEILVKDNASLQTWALISLLADGNKSRGRNIYTEQDNFRKPQL